MTKETVTWGDLVEMGHRSNEKDFEFKLEQRRVDFYTSNPNFPQTLKFIITGVDIKVDVETRRVEGEQHDEILEIWVREDRYEKEGLGSGHV